MKSHQNHAWGLMVSGSQEQPASPGLSRFRGSKPHWDLLRSPLQVSLSHVHTHRHWAQKHQPRVGPNMKPSNDKR